MTLLNGIRFALNNELRLTGLSPLEKWVIIVIVIGSKKIERFNYFKQKLFQNKVKVNKNIHDQNDFFNLVDFLKWNNLL